jgi:splicing factor 3B subunit 2
MFLINTVADGGLGNCYKFFRWQSKPKMTIHGDLYYEGKEFETRMKDKKPGDLSDDLRTALGMPVGPNSNRIPPPWLIAMQR